MYASTVWFPSKTDMAKLEVFQCRISRWLSPKEHYFDRLVECQLLPLSLRFQLNDITHFNKLLHAGEVDDMITYENRDTFRTNIKFEVKRTRLQVTDGFYFNRIVKLSNICYRYNTDLFGPPHATKKELKKIFWNYFSSDYDCYRCKRFIRCYCCH